MAWRRWRERRRRLEYAGRAASGRRRTGARYGCAPVIAGTPSRRRQKTIDAREPGQGNEKFTYRSGRFRMSSKSWAISRCVFGERQRDRAIGTETTERAVGAVEPRAESDASSSRTSRRSASGWIATEPAERGARRARTRRIESARASAPRAPAIVTAAADGEPLPLSALWPIKRVAVARSFANSPPPDRARAAPPRRSLVGSRARAIAVRESGSSLSILATWTRRCTSRGTRCGPLDLEASRCRRARAS